MKSFKFTINGNEYSVDLHEIEANMARLEVNGTRYEVELHREQKTSKTPTLVRPVIKEPPKPVIDKREGGSAHPITAPLPGAIVALKVGKGDIVEKGQLLLTMEAMKMENQVLSDRAGVVEHLHVKPGDAVLQGDVLLEIV
ncbi:MAG: acetyl-CoA carboxylase biotin carboxyl carrier protein subunit [Bacteroidetes bacterium]|nr:MAG: acetyl-CoA carboxylase biotin carboxyl carrier protein subunit [Bacteroidota bacterium]